MTDQPDPMDVTDPTTGAQVSVGGRTRAEQQARLAALQAKWGDRDARTNMMARLRSMADLARDKNWDWLEKYSATAVAQIQFVQDQAPNAGSDWGALLAPARDEALRLGESYLMVEVIRLSQAIVMLLDLFEQLITGDVTLAVPPDR